MKKTNVDLNKVIEVADDDATMAIVVKGSNEEDVAKVADILRTLDIKEDSVKAKVTSCKAAVTLEIKRQPIAMDTSFSIKEEGEAAYVVPSYKKESSLDKEVKMKYTVGNAAKPASINQTITTGAKENSSYVAENKEAKTKVVIEENVDKRTQTVEQLMGEL